MRRAAIRIFRMLGAGACLLTTMAHGAGSWVATAPALQAALVERPVASAPLAPPDPALARGQMMGQVSWQFQPPSGVEVNAALCHLGGCVRLPAPRGHTEALAGLPADTPLYFEFSLLDRRQRVVTLQGLQVIVNHAHDETLRNR